MMKKNHARYDAPMLEVYEVAVEDGFGVSGGAGTGSYNPWSAEAVEAATPGVVNGESY